MLVHTIAGLAREELEDQGLPLSMDMLRFIKFIATEIFPGGRLPSIDTVQDHWAAAGFTLTRRQSLQLHYVRTLDLWAHALQAHEPKRSSFSPRRSTSGT